MQEQFEARDGGRHARQHDEDVAEHTPTGASCPLTA
jgi:hypothetical protein